MSTTLVDTPARCQQSCLDDVKSKEELTHKAVEEILEQLDDTDLRLLWWIVEFEKATARMLSQEIFLSRKATLHRARQKVELGLARTESTSVSKGEIKPASFFSPANGLTKAAIEKAMAASSPKVQSSKSMSRKKSENTIDDIGILILGLLYFDVANTVDDIQEKLGCTQGVVRTRLKKSEKNGWVSSVSTHPFAHRPGLTQMVYSPSASLDKETMLEALDTVELRRISFQFKLDPSVDWARMGVRDYQEFLNMDIVASSNGHKPIETERASLAQAVAINGFHPVDGGKQLKPKPQRVELAEEDVWVVLRTMAEKLAEYEERLAQLESRPQDSLAQQMSAEILAIIPPVASKKAS